MNFIKPRCVNISFNRAIALRVHRAILHTETLNYAEKMMLIAQSINLNRLSPKLRHQSSFLVSPTTITKHKNANTLTKPLFADSEKTARMHMATMS